jgi:DNA-binding beta-propeller fold protein YncE
VPSVAPTPTPVATPGATPQAEIIHIPLSGRGPLGLVLDGDVAWTVAHDSGDLISIDLPTARETASFGIGSAGTHVVVDGDEVFVGRYDPACIDECLTVVNPGDEEVSGIETGPLASIARADDGRLWALEQSGTVLLIDPTGGATLDFLKVQLAPNEHRELVPSPGTAWVGSDSTAVRRVTVTGTELSVGAEIDPGGGIPFVFRDGLVWGARADELWAIDPAANDITERVALTELMEILALDVGDGEAWIAARRPGVRGTVIRVDLETGQVLDEWAVRLPAAVAIAADRVWVTDAEAHELVGLPR